MSSLGQQLSDTASPPLAITMKNSINLVTIKSSKTTVNGGGAGSSSKIVKENGKSSAGDSAKIPKLTPMKGYDGLGILTPATSPKNQVQQQQQQQQLSEGGQSMLNGSGNSSMLNGSADSLQSIPLTPVSPAPSPSSSTTSTTSYQQMKKSDS